MLRIGDLSFASLQRKYRPRFLRKRAEKRAFPEATSSTEGSGAQALGLAGDAAPGPPGRALADGPPPRGPGPLQEAETEAPPPRGAAAAASARPRGPTAPAPGPPPAQAAPAPRPARPREGRPARGGGGGAAAAKAHCLPGACARGPAGGGRRR